MRILYLAPPRSPFDQISSYSFIDEEIQALANRGHTVFLISYPIKEESDVETSICSGVYIKTLPAQSSAKQIFKTCKFLWQSRTCTSFYQWRYVTGLYHLARLERFATEIARSEDIDIVHSNFGWPGGFGGALMKIQTGLPLVTTLRGMDVLQLPDIDYGGRMSKFYDQALRMLLNRADYAICVSDFIRGKAIDIGASYRTTVTVRKGVDLTKFGRAHPLRERSVDTPTILTVGGFIKRKGIDTIIEALGMIKESRKFNFIIAGSGPLKEDLRRLVSESGIDSCTEFVGQVPRHRIQDVFSRCDIFVLGSRLEASGNVNLEAMAAGRPVVTTDSGGPPEYVVDGETGFVVPPDDPESMSRRIAELIENSDLRQNFGIAGQRRAREHFAYETMISGIETIYRRAVDDCSADRSSDRTRR